MEDRRFISVRGQTVELIRNAQGFWEAPGGTIFAYGELSHTVDPVTRCGIGFFSLSETNDITDACRPHDFAYNSPVYQAFHTREEADQKLETDITLIGQELRRPWYQWVGKLFRKVAEVFGGKYWENKETR